MVAVILSTFIGLQLRFSFKVSLMFNQSGHLLLLLYLYFLSLQDYANSYKTIIFSLL